MNNYSPSKKQKSGVKYSDDKPPIYTLNKQFSNAIAAVSMRSLGGHNKYLEYDEDWQNFSRVDNPDYEYANAMFRHALSMGGNESEIAHLAASAWDALARLEMAIRNSNEDLKTILNQCKEV